MDEHTALVGGILIRISFGERWNMQVWLAELVNHLIIFSGLELVLQILRSFWGNLAALLADIVVNDP